MSSAYPLRTERLLLRPLREADIDTVLAYRNDPAVAALQDWDLPVSQEHVAEQVARTWSDIEPGQSRQIGIEHDGELLGDLYVGLDEHGGVAEIGFTLRTEHQGKGYASEAVSAVVDDLIDRLGVHRLTAELSKDNVASIRLLERIGMTFEFFAEKSFWWRGTWDDNLHYSMSAQQRRRWRDRPRSAPESVRLVDITVENERAYRRLRTHHSQEAFVDSVVDSYADALFPWEEGGQPVTPVLLGIEADGEPTGFVMYADVVPGVAEPYLWRFLIDRAHQRRGIGTVALDLLLGRLREAGHAALRTSWQEGRGGPEPFYLGMGFTPTGEYEDGERVARRTF